MSDTQNRAIHFEEFRNLNGIDHYLLHAGMSRENPVMLCLHSGPGFVSSLFHHRVKEWEELFTVVHWDQRGAGKTLTQNPNAHPTMALLISDLYEIIQYLKKRYFTDKVVLFGHSWGTVLGTTFIKAFPDEVSCYIGSGQVIDFFENERLSYQKMAAEISRTRDPRALKKLQSIGDYPGNRIDSAFIRKNHTLSKLKAPFKLDQKFEFRMLTALLTSPIFKLSDIIAFMKGGTANQKLFTSLEEFGKKTETAHYQLPIYYILGEDDWVTPTSSATRYFEKLTAPHKSLFTIKNAGHTPMADQPVKFFEALSMIRYGETVNGGWHTHS